MSFEELRALADENAVGELYRVFVDGLRQAFSRAPGTSKSSICFVANLEDTKSAVVFSLLPGESSGENDLKFIVYLPRLMEEFGLSESEALALLPAAKEPYSYGADAPPDLTGYTGFFRAEQEVRRFLAGLNK